MWWCRSGPLEPCISRALEHLGFGLACVCFALSVCAYLYAAWQRAAAADKKVSLKVTQRSRERLSLYMEVYVPIVRWAEEELGVWVVSPAATDTSTHSMLRHASLGSAEWNQGNENERLEALSLLKNKLKTRGVRAGDLLVLEMFFDLGVSPGFHVAAHIPRSQVHKYFTANMIARLRGMHWRVRAPQEMSQGLATDVIASFALMVDPSVDAAWMQRHVIEQWNETWSHST